MRFLGLRIGAASGSHLLRCDLLMSSHQSTGTVGWAMPVLARNPHAVPQDGEVRWFLVQNKTLGKQDWRRATICQQGNLWNRLASIGSQIGMKFPRLGCAVRGKPNSPIHVDFGNRLCQKAKDLPTWKENFTTKAYSPLDGCIARIRANSPAKLNNVAPSVAIIARRARARNRRPGAANECRNLARRCVEF